MENLTISSASVVIMFAIKWANVYSGWQDMLLSIMMAVVIIAFAAEVIYS